MKSSNIGNNVSLLTPAPTIIEHILTAWNTLADTRPGFFVPVKLPPRPYGKEINIHYAPCHHIGDWLLGPRGGYGGRRMSLGVGNHWERHWELAIEELQQISQPAEPIRIEALFRPASSLYIDKLIFTLRFLRQWNIHVEMYGGLLTRDHFTDGLHAEVMAFLRPDLNDPYGSEQRSEEGWEEALATMQDQTLWTGRTGWNGWVPNLYSVFRQREGKPRIIETIGGLPILSNLSTTNNAIVSN